MEKDIDKEIQEAAVARSQLVAKLMEFEFNRGDLERGLFFLGAGAELIRHNKNLPQNFKIPELRRLLDFAKGVFDTPSIVKIFELLIETLGKEESPPYQWMAQLCLNWYTTLLNSPGSDLTRPFEVAISIIRISQNQIPPEMRENIFNRYILVLQGLNKNKEAKRISLLKVSVEQEIAAALNKEE